MAWLCELDAMHPRRKTRKRKFQGGGGGEPTDMSTDMPHTQSKNKLHKNAPCHPMDHHLSFSLCYLVSLQFFRSASFLAYSIKNVARAIPLFVVPSNTPHTLAAAPCTLPFFHTRTFDPFSSVPLVMRDTPPLLQQERGEQRGRHGHRDVVVAQGHLCGWNSHHGFRQMSQLPA